MCGDGDTINLLLKTIHLNLFFWSDQTLGQFVCNDKLAFCRTYIRAAAALDAEVDLERFELVDVLHLESGFNQRRHQTHRAGSYAAAAADAGGFLVMRNIRFCKGKQRVIIFDQRVVDVKQRGTHHWTTHQQLGRFLGKAAAEIDDASSNCFIEITLILIPPLVKLSFAGFLDYATHPV